MKANIKSTARMTMGSNSNMEGGGGNGGRMRGSISRIAVRHMSKSIHSKLKHVVARENFPHPIEMELLLLCSVFFLPGIEVGVLLSLVSMNCWSCWLMAMLFNTFAFVLASSTLIKLPRPPPTTRSD